MQPLVHRHSYGEINVRCLWQHGWICTQPTNCSYKRRHSKLLVNLTFDPILVVHWQIWLKNALINPLNFVSTRNDHDIGQTGKLKPGWWQHLPPNRKTIVSQNTFHLLLEDCLADW